MQFLQVIQRDFFQGFFQKFLWGHSLKNFLKNSSRKSIGNFFNKKKREHFVKGFVAKFIQRSIVNFDKYCVIDFFHLFYGKKYRCEDITKLNLVKSTNLTDPMSVCTEKSIGWPLVGDWTINFSALTNIRFFRLFSWKFGVRLCYNFNFRNLFHKSLELLPRTPSTIYPKNLISYKKLWIHY